MGRKPQDLETKKSKGETRPCRLQDNVISLPTVLKIPSPPKWINTEGKKLWNEIAPVLHTKKLLTTVDIPALAHLCQLHGELIAGYRKKIQPTAAQLAQLKAYFSEFCLTPVSRMSRGVKGSDDKENRFKRNGVTPQTGQAGTLDPESS